MLPAISVDASAATDKSVSPPRTQEIPALSLTPMTPARLSIVADAVSRLRHVEYVEVAAAVKSDDATLYTINIYLRKDQSRLPAGLTTRPKPSDIHMAHDGHLRKPAHLVTPDLVVHHRFSDFDDLRHALLDAVQDSHQKYCELCNRYLKVLLFSSTRPAMAAPMLLPSTDMRVKVLDKFLRGVMAAYVSSVSRSGRRESCRGSRELPLRLSAFLLGETASS